MVRVQEYPRGPAGDGRKRQGIGQNRTRRHRLRFLYPSQRPCGCREPRCMVDLPPCHEPRCVVALPPGHEPRCVVDLPPGHEPRCVVDLPPGYEPRCVVDLPPGHEPRCVVELPLAHEPRCVVDLGAWLICPRGRLPIILGPRRGQNGVKMSDLESIMEPRGVQNRSRRTPEIDEKPLEICGFWHLGVPGGAPRGVCRIRKSLKNSWFL